MQRFLCLFIMFKNVQILHSSAFQLIVHLKMSSQRYRPLEVPHNGTLELEEYEPAHQ